MRELGEHEANAGETERVPAARMDDLVVTEAGGETLVYDTRSHHIHQLNAITATIWQLCDGRRSIRSMVRDASSEGHQVSEPTVRMALGKLEDASLLEGTLPAGMRSEGQSRRGFLRGVAKGTAVALPAIVSITAPTARVAASTICKEPVVPECKANRIGFCCEMSSGERGVCDLWQQCSETVDGSRPEP